MADESGSSGAGGDAIDEVLRLAMRAQEGDRAAFGELIGLHEEAALGLAIRVLRDPEAARDAVQEAFLRAYRYLRSFDAGRSFRSWLMRIVLHEALDSRRLREARSEAPLLDPDQAGGATPAGQERDVLANETRRALEALLGELTARERAAFVLRDVEGWPTAEVAEALACREATVRRHLSLARQRLRYLLRHRFPDLLPGGEKD